MLQRYSVQHRQETQTRLNNVRYPVNATCVSTIKHIEITANTHWFTVYIEDQDQYPTSSVCEKEIDKSKEIRLINCLWYIKHGEDMPVATEEESAKMHDTTGDTPPVSEDGPAPRPRKF